MNIETDPLQPKLPPVDKEPAKPVGAMLFGSALVGLAMIATGEVNPFAALLEVAQKIT